MEEKTYEQWKAEGYHVLKGMKSRNKNSEGVALFTYMQVERNKSRYCYGNLEDDMDDNLEDDPYYGCECF